MGDNPGMLVWAVRPGDERAGGNNGEYPISGADRDVESLVMTGQAWAFGDPVVSCVMLGGA